MNRQQAFDRAVSALIEQGEPAYSEFGCCYRTDGGLKCAVGHLMPEDKYQPGFEGVAASEPQILRAAGISAASANFLEALQDTHDGPAEEGLTDGAWVEAFKKRARIVADDFGLSAKVLAASGMEARQGGDREDGRHAKHDSPTGEAGDAQ
jgi:hypothetical protein